MRYWLKSFTVPINELKWVYDKMLKHISQILNIIMCVSFGVFIGHGIYVYWDFQAHPNLYAMQSAPWYTSIQIYGIITLIILLVCSVLKVIIWNYHRKNEK